MEDLKGPKSFRIENNLELLLLEMVESDYFDHETGAIKKFDLRKILEDMTERKEVAMLDQETLGSHLLSFGYLKKNKKDRTRYYFKLDKLPFVDQSTADSSDLEEEEESSYDESASDEELCSVYSSENLDYEELDGSILDSTINDQLYDLLLEVIGDKGYDPKSCSIRKTHLRRVFNTMKRCGELKDLHNSNIGSVLFAYGYLMKSKTSGWFHFYPDKLQLEDISGLQDCSESEGDEELADEEDDEEYESDEYWAISVDGSRDTAIDDQLYDLLEEVVRDRGYDAENCAIKKAYLHNVMGEMRGRGQLRDLRHRTIGRVLYSYGYLMRNKTVGWFHFHPDKMPDYASASSDSDSYSTESTEYFDAVDSKDLGPVVDQELYNLLKEAMKSREFDAKTCSIRKKKLRSILDKQRCNRSCTKLNQRNLGSMLLTYGYCKKSHGSDPHKYFFTVKKMPRAGEGRY